MIIQVSPHGQIRVLDELQGEHIGIKRFIQETVTPFLARHYHGFECEKCAGTENNKEQPVKDRYSHLQDALQYA